jgi:carboxymethylenebutenolidase
MVDAKTKLQSLLVGFLALAALAVSARSAASQGEQPWAKARLENSRRHREFIDVKHGDRTVTCFIVYPEVPNKAQAVIVIHEIFGLADWVRSVCDQLAEAGYIAIAPDLLSGMGPNKGGTESMGGGDNVTRAVRGLPKDQVTADLNAVAAYVTKLDACNGNLSVCGFCWGGSETFRYAANNKNIKAAYVFYGSGPTAEEIARINCPVYGFYGQNDARVNATIPRSKELMAAAKKTYDPVTYDGAGHGFMRSGEDPGGPAGDKKAREEGWTRWKELLKKTATTTAP